MYAYSPAGVLGSSAMTGGSVGGVVGGPVVGTGIVGGPVGGYVGGGAGYVGGGAGATGCSVGTGGIDCGGAGYRGAGTACGTGAGCGNGTYMGSMMSYVGVGDYVQETTYRYVGTGAGTHAVIPVVAPPNYCWCSLWLLLLIPLFFLLSSSSPATTVPPPPPPAMIAAQKACTVYGDPHVLTFDGSHQDYYTPGEYWIVKSSTVHIQGAYGALPMTNGLGVTKAIAIGGPFLKGHKLIVRTVDTGAAFVTYDGHAVLSGFPSSFKSNDGLVSIQYNSEGGIIQYGRGGKQKHVLHISLPFGITIQVNEWNEASEGPYMNLKIMMSPQPNQDGHCGNFNGNEADDVRTQVRARVGKTGVPAGPDFLFPWGKTPINPSGRPDMNDCPDGTLKRAKDVCRKKEGGFFPTPACLIDQCFGGGVM